jgi:hypothetical protein
MLKVFISCDPADRPQASVISTLFEKVFEAEVFIADHSSLSPSWRREAGKRLGECDVIIPFVTRRSCTNPWVLFEAGAGLIRGNTIPVVTADLKLDTIPEPFQLLPARQLTREGLNGLLEDVGRMTEVVIPPGKVGVQEALYRLQALTPRPPERKRRKREPSQGVWTAKAVHKRVEQLIERTHKVLTRLIVNSMSPNSALAEADLNGMLLHQLRDIADYAGVKYPSFLLYTLSSLQQSQVLGDDASWSLFGEAQLDRLEQSLVEFEHQVFGQSPPDTGGG